MNNPAAIQIVDDEFVEFDIEIYRVDRSSNSDDYVVLKINDAETYMSLEEARNIASILIEAASEEGRDEIS